MAFEAPTGTVAEVHLAVEVGHHRGQRGQGGATGGQHPLGPVWDVPAVWELLDSRDQLGVVVGVQPHQATVDVDVHSGRGHRAHCYLTRSSSARLSAPSHPRRLGFTRARNW